MLRPLNLADVNSLLVHLPQRTHISESLHMLDHLKNIKCMKAKPSEWVSEEKKKGVTKPQQEYKKVNHTYFVTETNHEERNRNREAKEVNKC